MGEKSSSSSSSNWQNGNLQLEIYNGNNNTKTKNNWNDQRSYTLDNSSYNNNQPPQFHQNSNNNFDSQFPNNFDNKLKKSKTFTSSKIFCFSDPEFKRKKRVASYRAYTVEGKVKGTFRRSFTWLKDRFIHGFW